MIRELIRLIKQSEHDLYPAATEEEIRLTEAALGKPLPESYRLFLKELSNGAYLYMSQEVCNVGEGTEQLIPIQNTYLHVAIPDEDYHIPFFRQEGSIRYKDCIPFSFDSNGNAWFFLADRQYPENEYPVAYLDATNPLFYGKLSGFGEWLGILVKEQEEVIRALYGDDVIVHRLCLG